MFFQNFNYWQKNEIFHHVFLSPLMRLKFYVNLYRVTPLFLELSSNCFKQFKIQSAI